MSGWSAEDAPDQAGRTMVVTGASSGIGLEAARMLAGRGAAVVLACRDVARGEAAARSIRASHPGARVDVAELDLASLDSVQAFAEALSARLDALDVLVNNAGVMALPRRTTRDGFEMQLGTNHLGHFALTARLFGVLERAAAPRVVNVSSGAHKGGVMRWDDLQGERSYSAWGAYAQSKLANLLFTYELERRLRKAGRKAIAVACHPGYAATNLQHVGPAMTGSRASASIMRLGNAVLAQSAEMGALPTVYAAASPDVVGGQYIGPSGLFELRGGPSVVRSNRASRDEEAAARLWAVSEELTKVPFAV